MPVVSTSLDCSRVSLIPIETQLDPWLGPNERKGKAASALRSIYSLLIICQCFQPDFLFQPSKQSPPSLGKTRHRPRTTQWMVVAQAQLWSYKAPTTERQKVITISNCSRIPRILTCVSTTSQLLPTAAAITFFSSIFPRCIWQLLH